MAYQYLENVATADVAFEATGKTLEELFCSAADATVNVMADDLNAVQPKERRELKIQDEKMDLLLYKFLREIVYFKDAEKLLLRAQDICIKEKPGEFTLSGTLCGERLDPPRHKLKVDIKAITLHQLKVERAGRGWRATVVVDI